MKKRIQLILCLVALCFATGITGCHGEKRPKGFPRLYSCTITVLQANNPLSGANLILYADNAEHDRWSIGGTTNEAGVANIATNGKFPGAPKGNFTIVITKEEQNRKNIAPPDTPEPEFVFGKSYSLIDPKYGKKETSPAKISIEGRSSHQIDVGPVVRTEIK